MRGSDLCVGNLSDLLTALPQADWNIVKRGWDAHVLGKAPFKFTDPVEAIKSLRVRGLVCHRHEGAVKALHSSHG